MTKAEKKWIDEASYTAMLKRLRFSSSPDTIFAGESGDYFSKIMKEKEKFVDHVAISKQIGWK